MRKIIVYIAISADGFIARPDGDVAWLDRPRDAGDYGMGRFYRTIDTVIMGRKTYDLAQEFDKAIYPDKKNYVFSRTSRQSRSQDVEFVKVKVGKFAKQLRTTEGKNIWLVGGAELIATFLDEGQIDEFIIFVIPTIIGEGIPLISPRHRMIPLNLLSTRSYRDGVVRLHYSVPQQASKKATAKKGTRQKRR